MFDELNNYKNNGHFFYKNGDRLKKAGKDIANAPGVYIIYRLAEGKIQLVYIGKSGTVNQDGSFRKQLLSKRITRRSRRMMFEKEFLKKEYDALDIYWYVTFDNENRDLPAYVEGLLLQRYYEVHGVLPEWNKTY